MATQPKAQDPTAAALSAIEEALNLAQIAEPAPKETKPEPSKAQAASPAPARADVRQRDEADAKAPDVKAAEARRAAEAKNAAAPAAANDDRRSVGQILQAMQVRSNPAPLALAALASAVWVGLVGFYASTLGSLVPQQMAILAMS